MDDKLKPCPFCGSKNVEMIKSESRDNDPYHAACECGASAFSQEWNNRPLENTLKKALDQFFDAAKYILENEYTHNMNKRKMRAANVAAISILKNGVKK